MKVGISRVALDQILDHADRHSEEEVCGLLLGRAGMIEVAQPAANVAHDRCRSFELDPAALLAAHRAARNGGLPVFGHYHSHPKGEALPSHRDAANAQPGTFWLIVGNGDVQLFEACANGEIHGVFRPKPFEVR
ncbi:MAG: M67 family metallopeptidase [Sphingomonadaceae bacterium]